MRLFAAWIGTETKTFAPPPSALENFRESFCTPNDEHSRVGKFHAFGTECRDVLCEVIRGHTTGKAHCVVLRGKWWTSNRLFKSKNPTPIGDSHVQQPIHDIYRR